MLLKIITRDFDYEPNALNAVALADSMTSLGHAVTIVSIHEPSDAGRAVVEMASKRIALTSLKYDYSLADVEFIADWEVLYLLIVANHKLDRVVLCSGLRQETRSGQRWEDLRLAAHRCGRPILQVEPIAAPWIGRLPPESLFSYTVPSLPWFREVVEPLVDRVLPRVLIDGAYATNDVDLVEPFLACDGLAAEIWCLSQAHLRKWMHPDLLWRELALRDERAFYASCDFVIVAPKMQTRTYLRDMITCGVVPILQHSAALDCLDGVFVERWDAPSIRAALENAIRDFSLEARQVRSLSEALPVQNEALNKWMSTNVIGTPSESERAPGLVLLAETYMQMAYGSTVSDTQRALELRGKSSIVRVSVIGDKAAIMRGWFMFQPSFRQLARISVPGEPSGIRVIPNPQSRPDLVEIAPDAATVQYGFVACFWRPFERVPSRIVFESEYEAVESDLLWNDVVRAFQQATHFFAQRVEEARETDGQSRLGDFGTRHFIDDIVEAVGLSLDLGPFRDASDGMLTILQTETSLSDKTLSGLFFATKSEGKDVVRPFESYSVSMVNSNQAFHLSLSDAMTLADEVGRLQVFSASFSGTEVVYVTVDRRSVCGADPRL